MGMLAEMISIQIVVQFYSNNIMCLASSECRSGFNARGPNDHILTVRAGEPSTRVDP